MAVENAMEQNVLMAPNLAEDSSLCHAFFEKSWGDINISLLQAGDVGALETAGRMAEHMGVSEGNLAFCRQIHSPCVKVVENPWPFKDAPEADAMVTNRKSVALGLFTADCVPVLFADPEAGIIGAAHAGWRGAIGGVLENTVAAMECLGAKRKDLRAALGPCIAQQSYEVGPDFPAPFLAENPAYAKFFVSSRQSSRFLFDLPGYVLEKLRFAGLENLAPPPGDTYAEPHRFFSYRYASQRGLRSDIRLVSAILLA